MATITEQLRQAADCAPLWKTIFEAAANEIERLQEDNTRLSRVQDILDNAEEVDHALSDNQLKAIKVDAVQTFLNDEAPLFDVDGLDPETHHCEFILHYERQRLHKSAKRRIDL